MIKRERDGVPAAGHRLLVFCLLLSLLLLLQSVSEAKLYIDITSPASRKLPIAITEFSGPFGREMSDTIRDDLDFTGFFITLDRNAFIETSSQPFNPRNWSVLR